MSRYLVIGAGAVGVALAAGLRDAGIPVVLVARGRSLDAIRERGLRYTRPETGTRVLDVPVVSGPQDLTLTPDDVLVLATKTQDAAQTLEQWAWRPVAGTQLVAADLPLLTTQNGLDAERVAARYFAVVVAGTTLIAARHVVPGHVHVANTPLAGQLILGAYPTAELAPVAAAAAVRIADDLRTAGWLAQQVPVVARWKAWKLLHNVTNAVAVLTGSPDELDTLRSAVVDEARAALTAAGYVFADPQTEREYDASLSAVGASSAWVPGQQSTWQSFARGAGSEVDFLTGEIVLLGRLHGVPTPASAAVQRVLGASAQAGEPPGTRHVSDVLDPTLVGAFA